MTVPWAISGVDLQIDLHRGGGSTGRALERSLREAVGTGRLAPGTRLPSSRQLAGDLLVARNTVAEVYGQLVAEGWLVARQGSGTRVADRAPWVAETAPATEHEQPSTTHDLGAGRPDLSAFPVNAWLRALRAGLNGAPATALGYSDPRGLPVLREALAGYLARVRGVRVTPDHVVVTSGATHALSLVCAALKAGGASTVAVEEVGLPDHRDVVASHGLGAELLAVDAGGADVAGLDRADAALLTPAHQFPTGVGLTPARRATEAAWASQSRLLLEDDYDGEFRYDRHPVGALHALAPDHVVYVGTASKTLAPGLRLGWLVLPTRLVDAVVAPRAVADVHTDVLAQLAMAELVSSGGYDRHVRRSRLLYRRRRDRLVERLRGDVPTASVTGIAAGLHGVLRLPAGVSEAAVVGAAEARGLRLLGLASYAARGARTPPAALVLGYATPPEHAFAGALDRLVGALRDVAGPA